MEKEPIGIKTLIALLKTAQQDATVYLDFAGFARPTKIGSYRGYYDRPALGFALGGYSGSDHSSETRVSELLKELDLGISDSFCGWKGGTYRYSGDETLFVDNSGDASGIVVTGIADEGCRVTITTAYSPDAY